ncbi:SNF2 family N-terminal domain-containing protein [Schizophyllum commune]
MASSHVFGYSKSTRAKCHGPPPCKGSPMAPGSLRYGQLKTTNLGENVEWRHWGCVTPVILAQLANVNLEAIEGFKDLQAHDRHKIREAVRLRRIDPADVPPSARVAAAPPPATQTARKRKAPEPASQPSMIQASSSMAGPSQPSQAFEDEATEDNVEEAADELYCTLSTGVVGIQYYTGLVGAGEEVQLIREPNNRYDRNAIRVSNIAGSQVGHIPKNVAARLAPLLDRGEITVEGVMKQGNLGSKAKKYSLDAEIRIYGRSDRRRELEPKLIWATPGQRGFEQLRNPSASSYAGGGGYGGGGMPPPPIPTYTGAASSSRMTNAQMEALKKQQEALNNAAELKQMLSGLEKVDDESRRNSVLDTLCSVDDVLKLPEHPDPPGIAKGDLVVELLKHQKQALQWAIEHEYPKLPSSEKDAPVQFWQYKQMAGRPYYYNLATKTPQSTPPALGKGALCADAMGLGKTLTMIALILATKADKPSGCIKGTLIVAPLSIISNWEKQLEDHCAPNALKSCTYYGATRGMSAEELKKYDVVITTYQVISGEWADRAGGQPAKKKKKGVAGGSLFDVKWKRIVLDEGHSIRNPRAKMTQACCALEADRRWVLTGTPIINTPRDLGSLLSFLRICKPLDEEDFFKRLLLRPLKAGDPSGAEILRALMGQICLRRTKEMQDSEGNSLVPLPPVDVTVVPVALDPETRKIYDEVEELSRQHVESLMNSTDNRMSANTASVLSMLTRMRQLALHPALIPPDYVEQLKAGQEQNGAIPVKVISAADKARLQAILARHIEDCEECPICFTIPNDPRITSCAHMFCLPCITEVISRDPKCPMDRRPLTLGDLIEPAPPMDLTQAPVAEFEEDRTGIRAGSSAKIDQLVKLLQLNPPADKSLVFSQFTSFLDKIAEALDEAGIPYARFDGQMSGKRREEAIRRFSMPIKAADIGAAIPTPTPAATTASAAAPSPIKPRRRASRKAIVDLDSDDIEAAGDDDFVMNGEDDDDDFEDDFAQAIKGKGKGRAVAPAKAAASNWLPGGVNPKVMLISLKAGALGLNLTVANNVYLWWQEGIESQAIDRVNRIGQTKPVHVYQMIAEDTVESKVLEIQDRKKKLIQQAFSGMKRTETQRQQREARLQDLIQIFGVQQNGQGNAQS